MRKSLVHNGLTDNAAAWAASRGLPHSTSIMRRVFYEHAGVPADKWDHYLDIYERHLGPLRGRGPERPVRLLEIGVQHGGSLQVLRRYLGPHAILHGLDIDPRPGAAAALEAVGAVLHIGDQKSDVRLGLIAEAMTGARGDAGLIGRIDVVIDDGSHLAADQIASFETLYPLMSPDGIYFCEDTHTSYWPEYGGAADVSGDCGFISYAERRVHELHAWHTDSLEDESFARTTRSVLFYDSMVVFERGIREPPRRSIVGRRPPRTTATPSGPSGPERERT